MNLRKESGEILTISLIFISIAITIMILILSVFISHVNSILYNLKVDMYALNRSAIISVNKGKSSVDDFSYNMNAYKNEFLKGLKKNYSLNDNLENDDKLISRIKIIEYKIYETGEKDSYTNIRCNNRVVHTILEVKIKPIILKKFFENIFVFTVHEDVVLNSMKVER